mmetsp:Transcript_13866/g.18118  ORF Transcript_13866/g.18118 Transcript_13866/m.18118 type:complete len:161 (+) Transcript_13866:281-763(+)
MSHRGRYYDSGRDNRSRRGDNRYPREHDNYQDRRRYRSRSREREGGRDNRSRETGYSRDEYPKNNSRYYDNDKGGEGRRYGHRNESRFQDYGYDPRERDWDRGRRRSTPPSSTLMIKGLGLHCTDGMIRSAFGDFANSLTRLSIIREKVIRIQYSFLKTT